MGKNKKERLEAKRKKDDSIETEELKSEYDHLEKNEILSLINETESIEEIISLTKVHDASM